MHNRFSSAFTERIVKLIPMMQSQIISRKWLPAIFIDSLQDLRKDYS